MSTKLKLEKGLVFLTSNLRKWIAKKAMLIVAINLSNLK